MIGALTGATIVIMAEYTHYGKPSGFASENETMQVDAKQRCIGVVLNV